MFKVLLHYTDFFDFDLFSIVDELVSSLYVSKKDFHELVNTFSQISLLILMLPLDQKMAIDTIKSVVKSKLKPKYLLCVSREFDSEISDLCFNNNYYYFSLKSDLSEFKQLITSILLKLNTTILNFADLSLDLVKRRCVRDSKVIPISNLEFYLLKYLLINQLRPVSKSELLEVVWGIKNPVSTRTLDVHISRLRKKIDSPFDKKYIKTVHSYGYIIS